MKRVRNLLFLASSLLSIGGLLLAFKRRVHGVFLFATLLLSYPLIYYITVPEPRYRHAIEPELVILAVLLLLLFLRSAKDGLSGDVVRLRGRNQLNFTLRGNGIKTGGFMRRSFRSRPSWVPAGWRIGSVKSPCGTQSRKPDFGMRCQFWCQLVLGFRAFPCALMLEAGG